MKNNRNMVISLIGRPNVGKSSIFNALMKRQNKAMTYDMPGVTRDRHYGIATFDEVGVEGEVDSILVDTGGFYPQSINEESGSEKEQVANKFFNIMTDHARLAIEESDIVLFVVDVREGILPFDESIAKYIRSQKKEFWVIANKYDTHKQAGTEAEFYGLGIDGDNLFPVSAAHGLGISDLRQSIHRKILEFNKRSENAPSLQKGVTPSEQVVSRLALIGAPNAGKSTLLNKLVGADRALVSNIPGTTVDPIEGYFDLYFGADALELEETIKFGSDNNMLFQQYEDFRANNPDVYETISSSYNKEEEMFGELGIYEPTLEEFHEDFTGEKLEASNEDSQALQEELEEIEDLDVSVANELDEVRNEELQAQIFDDNEESEEIFEEVEDEEIKSIEGSLWRSIHIVDTAGIRRKKAIAGFVEEQSVYRSLRCISESDIILFMIDAEKGMGHQDRRLLDIALDKGKSVIVCMNKSDLIKDQIKTEKEKREWIENMRSDIPWLNFCDIITISAKHGKGIKALRNAIKKTIFVRRRPVPTGQLNRAVFGLIEKHPIIIAKAKGRRLKVKYTSQIKSNPPTFLFYTNRSRGIPDNYKRYIKNGLRSEFALENTPIHLIFRTGADLEKRMNRLINHD